MFVLFIYIYIYIYILRERERDKQTQFQSMDKIAYAWISNNNQVSFYSLRRIFVLILD